MATGRIYVEGNIASGKSTLLRALETEGLLTVPEPVQEFGEELRSFYEKRTRHACVALEEKVACLCYASQRQSNTRAPAIVYERSCFTASEIFSCAYLEAGLLEEANVRRLRGGKDEPGSRVYHQLDPEICCERAQARARPEEESMPTRETIYSTCRARTHA